MQYALLIQFFLSFSLTIALPSSLFAQVGSGLPHFRQPPLVRIVASLSSLEEKQRGNLRTLTVYIKGKTWKLRIREITSLTATTKSGWRLLNDLFPPKLHLIGPEELLVPLQTDDIAGKPLELEGRLYVGDHQLFLTNVTIAADHTNPASPHPPE